MVAMSDRAAPAPPTSLRREHSDATRNALIAQGRAAFGALGYQEAGIEAVARAARVSRGALYHHFRDKKALFEAVVLQLQEEATAEVSASVSKVRDPWDQLAQGVEAYLEICRRAEYRRIVAEDAPAVLGKARCAEIERQHAVGFLKQKLETLRDANRIADLNVEILSNLLGAIIGEGAALIAQRKSDAQVRAVLRTLLSSLRPGV